MNKHLWFTIVASSLFVGSAYCFTYDGSNWVKNGDFESTGTGYTSKSQNSAFGWQVGGWLNNGCSNTTAEVRSYSSVWDFADANYSGYHGPSASSRGNNFLVGGGPATNTPENNWWVLGLYQDFWLWSDATAIARIDAGNLKFALSAYLGGITTGAWAGTQSGASLLMKCTGTYTGSQEFKLDQVNTNNIKDGTNWWSNLDYKKVEGLVPVGTRRIEMFIFLNHWSDGWSGAGNVTDPDYNYGAIDNVQLNIGSAPVPEPMSMIALGLGAVGLIARRRRK